MSVRVRFAPSPTGHLHVGGARTALFNWLFARGREGAFLLRIEDTDVARSEEALTGAILDGLRWLGLEWDEGPVRQSERRPLYREAAGRLLEEGLAYRCFCTPEELARRRAEAEARGEVYEYDRHCLREVSPEESRTRAEAGEPFAVRFRVPEGETGWEDLVHGTVRFDHADIEDFVVLRGDGMPLYNLSCVVDDAEAAITHVIRGDDHLSNTPKQILLYEALGEAVPDFAHVPMILGPDGKRLSKRHGATAIAHYDEEGFLPWAMVNFLALLGWSPGTDEEVMEVDELVERFSLDRVLRKSGVFDREKLEWLSGQHFSRAPAARLEPLVLPRLAAAGLADPAELAERREWLHRLIDLLKVRARRLGDIVEQARPYLADEVEYEPEAVAKHWKDPGTVAERLEALGAALDDGPWEEGALEERLRALAAELDVGAGKLIHPLRVALVGQRVSPGIFDVLAVLGRQRSLARTRAAVERLRRLAAESARMAGG